MSDYPVGPPIGLEYIGDMASTIPCLTRYRGTDMQQWWALSFFLDHINVWVLLQLWRGFMSVGILTNEVTYVMFCATPSGIAPDSFVL